jgi:hypothetical protein
VTVVDDALPGTAGDEPAGRPRRRPPRTPGGIPLAELGERDASGVSRLDIAWRAAEVLATRKRPPLPRWVDAAVVVFLSLYLVGGALAGLAAAPFTVAEGAQLSLVGDGRRLVTDPASLLPGGDDSQPAASLRLVGGAFTRYGASAGWYLAGGRADDVPALPVTDSPPGDDAPRETPLIAARTAPSLLAAAAVPILYLLGRRLGGRRVALAAAVLAFLHPAVLVAGRQVGDAGAVLAFGLGAVLVAVAVSDRLARGENPSAGRWAALAVLCGCTLAAGPGALGFVAGVVAWVVAGFGETYVRRRREIIAAGPVERPPSSGPPPIGTPVRGAGMPAGGPLTPPGGIPRLVAADAPDRPMWQVPPGSVWSFVLSLAGAVLLWVAVSPPLWGWLPERLTTRWSERSALVAQGLLPDPGDTGRLAALGRLLAGPFAASPDHVPGDRWWGGLPLGWGVALLLAPLTLAGVAALVTASSAGPPGGGRPPALGAAWRWLAERQVSRRNAVALLSWVLAVALFTLAWPSERSADAVPVIPVFSLLAAVALLVLSTWLSLARRRLAGRRR